VNIQRFEGWDIEVSNVSSEYIGDKNPYTSGATQVDVYGQNITIEFTLDAMDLTNSGGTASLSYERASLLDKVPSFRKALVKVLKDSKVYFIGLVTSQEQNQSTVRLHADSMLDILNGLEWRGTRVVDEIYNNVEGVYNEQDRADLAVSFESDQFYNIDSNTDYPLNLWSYSEMLSNAVDILKEVMDTTNFSSYIDFDEAIVALTEIDTDKAPPNKTIMGGIVDHINDLASSVKKMAVWSPEEGDSYTLSFVDVGQESGSSTITVRYTGNDRSADEVPYSYDFREDFNSPTEAMVYTGNAYIQTLLQIDPSGSYGEVVLDEAEGIERLVLSHDGASNEIFEELTRDDLPPTQKGNTWLSINNAIEIDEDTPTAGREIRFKNETDVYIKFKSDYKGSSFDSGFVDSGSHFLIGSDLWNEAIKNDVSGIVALVNQFDISLSDSEMKVVVEAPTVLKDDNGGADAELTIENFKTMVDRIYIPVTIEVPHKHVYLAERSASGVSIDSTPREASSVTYDGSTWEKGLFYPVEPLDNERVMVLRDDIRPIYQIKDVESYTDNLLVVRAEGVQFTELDESMIAIAGESLYDAIMSNNDSLRFNIPIELYFELSSFPSEFGDGLKEILDNDGDGGVLLAKVLNLRSKSYTERDVVLDYS
jgi:hypothetical protein